MQLNNLSVDRIIIHQIYKRDEEGKVVEPRQSHEFTKFDSSAMDAFISRVRDALGEGSKAVQMEVVQHGDTFLPKLAATLIDQNDDDFAKSSYEVARKLSFAQNTKSIPGGIVVVFTGKQGHPQQRFLGIIKAEIHSAYEKSVNEETQEISLKFVEEVLLTPGTRLYKTAAFFEKSTAADLENLNEKFAVMVSDYQISKADGAAAAHYFYSGFLGCGYPQTSARTTMQFYNAANSFIDGLNVSAEKKCDYFNALNTYLKVGASSSIGAADFASNYFDPDLQDDFKAHMEDAGLPTTAFTRDLEHIEGKLKTRQVKFSKNVKIIAPSDVFKDYINIETIDGDPDESGAVQQWTKIIVKDKITQQE
ncbi:nucleoid-associated protein [Microbulbifer sp. ARAS458-1]|uniref:nucleoid-associated protein n=1 Tax=Microbulbifer sp. ARAS458-1 TaxID=3140242 RepID=UPI0038781AB9